MEPVPRVRTSDGPLPLPELLNRGDHRTERAFRATARTAVQAGEDCGRVTEKLGDFARVLRIELRSRDRVRRHTKENRNEKRHESTSDDRYGRAKDDAAAPAEGANTEHAKGGRHPFRPGSPRSAGALVGADILVRETEKRPLGGAMLAAGGFWRAAVATPDRPDPNRGTCGGLLGWIRCIAPTRQTLRGVAGRGHCRRNECRRVVARRRPQWLGQELPPLTSMFVPVTYEASSESRNDTTRATSSAEP
jgi:hypothetical protein